MSGTKETSPRLTEVELTVAASAARVFAELADGWNYVGWVVGATHVRDVDPGWPAAGTRIHHQAGGWPLTISDSTTSLLCEPDRRLHLKARGWPLGEAEVRIELHPVDDEHTRVVLAEAPTAGPGRWVDNPVLRWGLIHRNRESLRRLRDRVEHRAGQ